VNDFTLAVVDVGGIDDFRFALLGKNNGTFPKSSAATTAKAMPLVSMVTTLSISWKGSTK
jgi:hypothetical protein